MYLKGDLSNKVSIMCLELCMQLYISIFVRYSQLLTHWLACSLSAGGYLMLSEQIENS